MWRALFEKLLIAFYFLRLRFGSQFKTRAQLEIWQQQKLKKLLKFVTANSKFYQARLREPF
jgi:phenylacetate-coenzyme A ligase PaaK-like adenylate-forming protein